MTRNPGRIALALLASAGSATPALAQLRAAAWNVSTYVSGNSLRDNGFKTSIYGTFQGRSLAPDFMLVQEISNTGSGAAFNAAAFTTVLNTAAGSPGDWALAPFFVSP